MSPSMKRTTANHSPRSRFLRPPALGCTLGRLAGALSHPQSAPFLTEPRNMESFNTANSKLLDEDFAEAVEVSE